MIAERLLDDVSRVDRDAIGSTGVGATIIGGAIRDDWIGLDTDRPE